MGGGWVEPDLRFSQRESHWKCAHTDLSSSLLLFFSSSLLLFFSSSLLLFFIPSTYEYSSLLPGFSPEIRVANPGPKSSSPIQLPNPGPPNFANFLNISANSGRQVANPGRQNPGRLQLRNYTFPKLAKKSRVRTRDTKENTTVLTSRFFAKFVHSVSEHIEWVAGGWSLTFV